MTPNPEVRAICSTVGLIPKLPMHPVHPMNTRIAVPIVSLMATVIVSRLVASSFIKLLIPVTRRSKGNWWFSSVNDDRIGSTRREIPIQFTIDRSVCRLSYGLTLAEPARQFFFLRRVDAQLLRRTQSSEDMAKVQATFSMKKTDRRTQMWPQYRRGHQCPFHQSFYLFVLLNN